MIDLRRFFRRFFQLRISITLKFIFAIFFLILISSATFGYFFVAREITLTQTYLDAYTNSIFEDFEFILVHILGTSKTEVLQKKLENLLRNEDVVFCILLDSEGNKIFHVSKEKAPEDNQFIHLITKKIGSNEAKSATLQIGFSLKKLENRITSLKRDILVVSLGIFGVGILFTLILTRIILKPIGKLAQATESVSRGELAHMVDVNSRDEIGDLARAFNQMIIQLKESRENLEKKVEERTRQLAENIRELNQARTSTLRMLENLQNAKRELEIVNRELKEADEARIKFIGIASHELKTPLTAIKANIDFILSEKIGKVPEYLKSYLQTIQRNTNRMQMRMDHMLDLSRIKSGRFFLYREPILLAEVIWSYVNEVKPVDKKILVTIDIPEDLMIYADRNGIHDIFVNLLSNAFKFTPDGGQVKIIARKKDNFILHEIHDTGIGIPSDKIERIFEEYYQVEGGKHGGTGLGLTIAKKLVEEHGGNIWAKSTLGEGSIFFFTIPLSTEEHNGRSVGR